MSPTPAPQSEPSEILQLAYWRNPSAVAEEPAGKPSICKAQAVEMPSVLASTWEAVVPKAALQAMSPSQTRHQSPPARMTRDSAFYTATTPTGSTPNLLAVAVDLVAKQCQFRAHYPPTEVLVEILGSISADRAAKEARQAMSPSPTQARSKQSATTVLVFMPNHSAVVVDPVVGSSTLN